MKLQENVRHIMDSDDLSKAVELGPNNGEAFYFRGFCYAELEQFELAIADFDKVIGFRPNFSTAYFYKGIILDRMNNKNEALSAYKMFLQYASHQSVQEFEYTKRRIQELGSILKWIKESAFDSPIK